MEEKPLLPAVLDDDQANIGTSTDLLRKYAIYEFYEQVVPTLFSELLPALQQNTPPGYFPFIRKTSGGLEVPTYDFVLRLFMFQSVHEQFVFAIGPLTQRSFVSDTRSSTASHRKCRNCVPFEIQTRTRRDLYVWRSQEAA